MIQLIKSPGIYHCINRPFGFILQGTNYRTASQPNSCKLFFNQTPSAGDYFKLSIEGRAYVFYFAETPDDSGFQLTAGAGLHTTFNELQANFYVSGFFGLSLQADHILFTTKTNGATFDIDFTNGPAPDLGYITDKTNHPADSFTENYQVFFRTEYFPCKGTQEPNPATISILDQYADVDQEGRTEIELSAVCKFLFPPLALPALEEALLLDYAIGLKFRFAEFYGAEPTVKKMQLHDGYCFVTPAFLRDDQLGILKSEGSLPPFLVSGLERKTHIQGFEAVTIFNNLLWNTPECWPVATVYKKDGSTSQLILAGMKKTIGYAQAVVFPVGPEVIFPSVSQRNEVDSYSLLFRWQYNDQEQGEVVTHNLGEVFFEVIDPELDYTQFLFVNRYGGWETLSFLSGTSRFLESDKSSSREPARLSDQVPEILVTKTRTAFESFESFSGQVDNEKEALQDFLLSDRVYLIKDKQFIPVVLADKNFEAGNVDEPASVRFKYRLAKDSR